LRAGELVQLSAFSALLTFGRRRAIQWALAGAPVETGEVSAVQGGPDAAVHIDIDAARTVGAFRRLVDLRERRIRRVGTWIEADDVTRRVYASQSPVHRLSPDRIVDRARHDAVERAISLVTFMVFSKDG
jgi:hypothetical protein